MSKCKRCGGTERTKSGACLRCRRLHSWFNSMTVAEINAAKMEILVPYMAGHYGPVPTVSDYLRMPECE
jgi:hypothetical protein